LHGHHGQLNFEKVIYQAHLYGIDVGKQTHGRKSYLKIINLIYDFLVQTLKN
jgi:hypothetical protein